VLHESSAHARLVTFIHRNEIEELYEQKQNKQTKKTSETTNTDQIRQNGL